jgi:hypothetical protein
MRLIKILGIVVSLALAVAAVVGISAASAAPITAKTCMNAGGTTECATTEKGTKFEATGTGVKLANEVLTNTCASKVVGEVTDAESAGADPVEAKITEAKFTGCDNASVTEEEVATAPWKMVTTGNLFAEGNMGEVTGAKVTLTAFLFFTCTYKEDATHLINLTWTNASRSEVKLSGTMKWVGGSGGEGLCGSQGSISGTYKVAKIIPIKGGLSGTNILLE